MSFEWVAQNWLVDGMLVYNLIHHPTVPPEITELKSRISPFVFINKFLRVPEMDAVGVDNYHAVNLAVEYLVAQGHRRIGTLYGNITSVDGFERKDAFEQALDRAGLPIDPRLEICGMWRDEDACQETRRMLESDARPTAMFCANDMMAIGAMRAIREKGLAVPRDISLVGYDDVEMCRYIDVPLTTIRPPLIEVGKRSVELLMEVLKDPARTPQQIALHAELVVRASTAKPAG
jgi:DNA-binding LacI/PurR family transcriptional regulator